MKFFLSLNFLSIQWIFTSNFLKFLLCVNIRKVYLGIQLILKSEKLSLNIQHLSASGKDRSLT